MDIPFDYNEFVTGVNFMSRKNEISSLANIIRNKGNAIIYDSPKKGKRSLVYQTFKTLQRTSYRFVLCHISLLNIRSSNDFLKYYANQLASCVSNTLDEWNIFTNKYLHSIDDNELSQEQMGEILSLGEKVASDYKVNLVVYVEEFQNILHFDKYDSFLKLIEEKWGEDISTSYIITGSLINAMKEIFEFSDILKNFGETITLSPLDKKEVSEHIIKTFLSIGRVVNPEFAGTMYDTIKGHPWYLWQLSSSCYNLTKGYLTEQIINDSIYSLIQLHSIRFQENIFALTNYQLSYLKAIIVEDKEINSINIVEKYNLNSNANLIRVKDALCKKEIITFGPNNQPIVIDPLFELWLKKYFFV